MSSQNLTLKLANFRYGLSKQVTTKKDSTVKYLLVMSIGGMPMQLLNTNWIHSSNVNKEYQSMYMTNKYLT